MRTGFSTSYLLFFLLIPVLNIVLNNITEKEHIGLIALCVMVFSIIPTMFIDVKIGYVGWFMVLYVIASYFRLYQKKFFENRLLWGSVTIVLLIISCMSVLACVWLNGRGYSLYFYFFVNDSNKLLALLPAVATFLFFKNLHLPYCKVINSISATTFGVLLIHANSDTMRQWLWKDVLNNVGMYNSKWLLVHAIGSVMAVYISCVLIDLIRINLIEKKVMGYWDKIVDKA